MLSRRHLIRLAVTGVIGAAVVLLAGCMTPQMELVDRSPPIPSLAQSFQMPTQPRVGPNDFSVHWRIWVINIYTGKIWYAGQGMMPLWSPDGEYLAMEVKQSARQWGIQVIGQDRPSCPAEVDHSHFGYAWGSDSRSIIYDYAPPGMAQP